MRFRTGVLLVLVMLVLGMALATTIAASVVVERAARTELGESLAADRQAFEDLQTYRQALFRSELRVVAEEPRLKAVAATEEITHATVLGVARELRQAVGCDLFLITDGEGRLLADVADPSASGYDMSSNSLVARALAVREASDLWTDAKAAYQVQARRLDFGKTVVGVLVIGYRLDDEVAKAVSRQTGGAVVIQMDGAPIAVSMPHVRSRPLDAVLRADLSAIPSTTDGPIEGSLEGDRFVAVSGTFPGYRGDRPLRYVLLRSLDRALAPMRALRRLIVLILAVATLAALGIGSALSMRLSRPIDNLVRFTGRIAKGDLTLAEASGPRELRALGEAMNKMVVEITDGRSKLAAQEQLRKELEIAEKIQTSIVPETIEVPGLDVAARMLPAEVVGGDYYDFVPVPGGCWIGIGDVAGHGLTAGLIMMMIQSVVASLARAHPTASPGALLSIVNAVMFDNIRCRLKQGEHATFCLARYRGDGRITFAGAHEELIVCPADGGPCRRVPTPGTWLGAVPDITRVTVDSELQLQAGDLVVLYTDGITEGMNAAGEQFGIDRLCAEVERARDESPHCICDRVLKAARTWAPQQVDDATLVVMRHIG